MSCTCSTHFWSIYIKYAIIVSFAMFLEEVLCLRIHFESVFFDSGFCRTQTTIWEHSAFQRFVSLQTNDCFKVFVDISWRMGSNVCGHRSISIEHAAFFTFFFIKLHYLFPQFCCSFCRTSKEGIVPFIGDIVSLNKVAYINGFIPHTCVKIFPCSMLHFAPP